MWPCGPVALWRCAQFWEEHDPRGWSIDKNESASGAGNQATGGMVVRADLTHEAYACAVCEWVDAGATIVGGCCGIGPAHMAQVCRRLRSHRRPFFEPARVA